jgi:exonuclease V gamma subunit
MDVETTRAIGDLASRIDQLEAWFDHLAGVEDGDESLQIIVDAVTDLFLEGDQEIRRAIETGFLEHILEQEALGPRFKHWARDERLIEAWQLALAWGRSHPDFMKPQRAILRAAERDS